MTYEPLKLGEEDLLTQLVDFVIPLLPPYETSLYLVLLRLTFLSDGDATVRIGKRTISKKLGKGTRSTGGDFSHITEKLKNLEQAGFITIGDSDRLGTEIMVRLPSDVPSVRELIALSQISDEPADDYFKDPALRKVIFARDGESCHYCGDTLKETTSTLDHVIPVSKGGDNSAGNLVAACLLCNSIKSGRTYEEAAPEILARLAAKRSGNSN